MAIATDARPPHARWLAIGAMIGVVLLMPLVAMQFTTEVQWTGFDFVAAALLLGGGAIGYELVTRRLHGRRRMIGVAAVLAITILLWAQGAVGLV